MAVYLALWLNVRQLRFPVVFEQELWLLGEKQRWGRLSCVLYCVKGQAPNLGLGVFALWIVACMHNLLFSMPIALLKIDAAHVTQPDARL